MRVAVARLGVAASLVVCLASVTPASAGPAQTVKPYIVFLLDVSGSMGGATGFGPPSCSTSDTKMDHAKCAIQKIANSYGDMVLSLARFRIHANSSPADNDCSNGCNWSGVGCNCDPTTGTGTCFAPTGDDFEVLAPLLDNNQSTLIPWVDFVCTTCGPGTSNPELFATGSTPIADALTGDKLYWQGQPSPTQGAYWVGAGSDPIRTDPLKNVFLPSGSQCRPYITILLTDGDETCTAFTNTSSAASAMLTTVVDGKTYRIETKPIGFGKAPGDAEIEGLAHAGGAADGPGNEGFYAQNEDDVELAVSSIVAGALRFEKCNGQDDDCDGATDEDFKPPTGSLGLACDDGKLGVCKGTGTYVCDAQQTGVTCNVTNPGKPPTSEVCNGLDDDCNGLVDDGISCQVCVPSCSPTQGCDICNGKDDDCDGKTDENFAPGACGLNIGQCKPGTTTCTNGVIACSGATGPTAEVCNGKDDDCDGITDGETSACYPVGTVGCNPDGSNCKGICRSGTSTCTAGVQGTCSGFTGPVTEIACNNQDDDCDGLVDEGKGPEICDGVDNDCDGNIDEDVAQSDPKIGTTCGGQSNVGACHPGTFQCIAGGYSCVGAQGPVAETCNNIDDNCNGMVDDGVASPGACGSSVGTCKPGTLQCQAGSFVCVGATGPTAEICDGKDNNCNGLTDETDPNLGMTCMTTPSGQPIPNQVGACHFGVLACSAGGLTCVGGVGPTAETCNRIDDDCDGVVDNGFPLLGQACDNGQQGICKQNGIYVCAANGQGVTCTAPAGNPGTETCNGLDDDCDGTTDELPMPVVGTVCAPANGMCQPGLWECVGGALQCGAASSGSNEVCNGKDDDCDNIIDEGPLATDGQNCYPNGTIGCDLSVGTCTGECKFGKTQCTNGNPDACNNPAPITPVNEICDGRDNDCDGTVDEAAACPPGDLCNSGECVVPCMTGEFPCSAGYDCVNLPEGNFCVPDPCKGVTCPGDQVCDHKTGGCIDLCAGLTCPSNEVCRQGFCLDCFHLPSLCTPGQLCRAGADGSGMCVDNPCDPNPCQPGQTCTNGSCSDACAGGCPDGTLCVNGSCTNDACAMVVCLQGQVCDPSTGECVNPKCDGISCNPGEVCVDTTGKCEPDPCLTTVCPTDQECTIDPDGNAVCGAPTGPHHTRITAAGGGCNASGDGAAPWLFGALFIPIVRRRGGRR